MSAYGNIFLTGTLRKGYLKYSYKTALRLIHYNFQTVNTIDFDIMNSEVTANKYYILDAWFSTSYAHSR